MFILFVAFVLIVITVIMIAMNVSEDGAKKALSFIVAVVLFVVVGAIMLPLSATAHGECASEEVRTVWIVKFILEDSAIEVIDEDGFVFIVDLQQIDYELGEEFELHLIENINPWLEEV